MSSLENFFKTAAPHRETGLAEWLESCLTELTACRTRDEVRRRIKSMQLQLEQAAGKCLEWEEAIQKLRRKRDELQDQDRLQETVVEISRKLSKLRIHFSDS